MTIEMKASHQWRTRPHDERFTSLTELAEFTRKQRDNSRSVVVSTRRLRVLPNETDQLRGLFVEEPNAQTMPTNWSFGQLEQLAGAPAAYLRDMPAPIAADCLNYGLRFNRNVEEVGLLTTAMPGI